MLALLFAGAPVAPGRAASIGPEVPLAPFRSLSLAGDVVAAGVGLRNTGAGTISISIPPGALIAQALLYWSIIAPQEPPLTASLNGHPTTGTLIAQAGDPCWPNLNAADAVPPTIFNWVFRADVSSFVVSGANTIADVPSGLTGGEDPLAHPDAYPLADGASLVVVYTSPGSLQRSIVINDGGQTFFGDTIATTLGIAAPGAVPPISARTIYIVADGQASLPHDGALFNQTPVAGPGSSIRPNDAFDGADGGGSTAANGLWDTLVVDVSALVQPADGAATASVVSGDKLDCLTWVAQVLSVVNASPPTTTTTSTTTSTTRPSTTSSTSTSSSTSSTSSSTTSTSPTTSSSTTSSSSTTTSITSTSTSSSTSSTAVSTTSTSSSTTSSTGPSTTETTSTTTSTTLPGGCDPNDTTATFVAIDCRLDALIDLTSRSEELSGLQRLLIEQLTRARARKLRAENLGRGRLARASLRHAAYYVTVFEYRVRSLAGRQIISTGFGGVLLRRAENIRTSMIVLLRIL